MIEILKSDLLLLGFSICALIFFFFYYGKLSNSTRRDKSEEQSGELNNTQLEEIKLQISEQNQNILGTNVKLDLILSQVGCILNNQDGNSNTISSAIAEIGKRLVQDSDQTVSEDIYESLQELIECFPNEYENVKIFEEYKDKGTGKGTGAETKVLADAVRKYKS